MKDKNILILMVLLFAALYFMPVGNIALDNSILSGFSLLHEYATQHILTCLLPAFFIAGAISVFVKKDSILKYLGSKSRKYISYSIASVSGAILAVCSCTIIPLFAGIRKKGAGLGPAITFLFAGPAINIAAIFLTMSILGIQIGIARITGAIVLSILTGLTMALIFREKTEKGELVLQQSKEIKLGKHILLTFFLSMVMVLVVSGLQIGFMLQYGLIAGFVLLTALIAIFKLEKETAREWLLETWGFTKLLLPYLLIGVFIAGFIMPLLPQEVIQSYVGQNSLPANLIASVFGAFMYFSTLTEIPIVQALIVKGMATGPALSLLLAGPSLSLPSMLAIRKILGTKKTAVYVLLVIVYSTAAGLIFGSLI